MHVLIAHGHVRRYCYQVLWQYGFVCDSSCERALVAMVKTERSREDCKRAKINRRGERWPRYYIRSLFFILSGLSELYYLKHRATPFTAVLSHKIRRDITWRLRCWGQRYKKRASDTLTALAVRILTSTKWNLKKYHWLQLLKHKHTTNRNKQEQFCLYAILISANAAATSNCEL
jgi:hypothetical protein